MAVGTTSSMVASSSAAPDLLQQLEGLLTSKDEEIRLLRCRVQILESVLKTHGINRVVTVDDVNGYPCGESSVTGTQTESESISSLTDAERSVKKTKAAVLPQAPLSETLKNVATVVEEDDDDDATQETSATTATFFTKRSLIMPPPEFQPAQRSPHPQGTQPGGRWYKLTSLNDGSPAPWIARFACTCADDNGDDERYVYYDRIGSHKYFSPSGEEIANPIHKKGNILTVVPNDGTMLSYYTKMRLPLYHQKQHLKLRVTGSEFHQSRREALKQLKETMGRLGGTPTVV